MYSVLPYSLAWEIKVPVTFSFLNLTKGSIGSAEASCIATLMVYVALHMRSYSLNDHSRAQVHDDVNYEFVSRWLATFGLRGVTSLEAQKALESVAISHNLLGKHAEQ